MLGIEKFVLSRECDTEKYIFLIPHKEKWLYITFTFLGNSTATCRRWQANKIPKRLFLNDDSF